MASRRSTSLGGPQRARGPAYDGGAGRSQRGQAAHHAAGEPPGRPDEGSGAVLAISAQQLVGALAGEGDGDVLGRKLGQCEEAQGGQVGERLVHEPHELLEVDLLVGGQLQLVMVGSKRGRDEARVVELAARVLREPDRERLHGLASCSAP